MNLSMGRVLVRFISWWTLSRGGELRKKKELRGQTHILPSCRRMGAYLYNSTSSWDIEGLATAYGRSFCIVILVFSQAAAGGGVSKQDEPRKANFAASLNRKPNKILNRGFFVKNDRSISLMTGVCRAKKSSRHHHQWWVCSKVVLMYFVIQQMWEEVARSRAFHICRSCCCWSHAIFVEATVPPVSATSANTLDPTRRSSSLEWISQHNTDPLSNCAANSKATLNEANDQM